MWNVSTWFTAERHFTYLPINLLIWTELEARFTESIEFMLIASEPLSVELKTLAPHKVETMESAACHMGFSGKYPRL